MHPILSDPRKLLSYVALLLAAGAGFGTLLVWAESATWMQALAFAPPVVVCFGFLLLSDYALARAWDRGKRARPVLLLYHAGNLAFKGLAAYGLALLWSEALGILGGPELVFSITRRQGALFVASGSALALLSMLAHQLLLTVEQVHLAEHRATESLLHAREAELQMLRAQINPHFLFNSLNSISALTSIDPAAARDMTVLLAQFFRQTLALSERKKIPLAEEIALLESYLAIEKIRFGDKLGVALELSAEARQALLPPLILQPLIENAVKHGVRNCPAGGRIILRALVRAGHLFVAVENPLLLALEPVAGSGLGLKNSRQRLASLYAEQARITWEAQAGRFLVELVLPLELEADQP
jgi:sensor histidine kinase YesM